MSQNYPSAGPTYPSAPYPSQGQPAPYPYAGPLPYQGNPAFGSPGILVNPDDVPGGKSFTTTWLLSMFLGSLGVDRFYLGKIVTGILKLITLGGFLVWWAIDLIILISGKQRDKRGLKLAGYEPRKRLALILTPIWILLILIFVFSPKGSAATRGSTEAPAVKGTAAPAIPVPAFEAPAAPKPADPAPVEPAVVAPAPAIVAPAPAAPATVKYASCDEVRAAGAAPLLKGQPGYSSKLDKDGDGTACEKTR